MADAHNNSWMNSPINALSARRISIIDTVARLQEAEQSTPVTTARYAPLFYYPLRAATERASVIITGVSSAEIVPMPERRHG